MLVRLITVLCDGSIPDEQVVKPERAAVPVVLSEEDLSLLGSPFFCSECSKKVDPFTRSNNYLYG